MADGSDWSDTAQIRTYGLHSAGAAALPGAGAAAARCRRRRFWEAKRPHGAGGSMMTPDCLAWTVAPGGGMYPCTTRYAGMYLEYLPAYSHRSVLPPTHRLSLWCCAAGLAALVALTPLPTGSGRQRILLRPLADGGKELVCRTELPDHARPVRESSLSLNHTGD